ncbi:MAG: carboxylesterase family protein, partial [Verrucomicrobiota bacterium]
MTPRLHHSILLALAIVCQALAHAAEPDARFKRLDKDGDGKISREETKGTVAEKSFDRFDKNKDGFLTPEETPRGRAAETSTENNAAAAIVTQMDIRYAEVPPGVDANHLSLDVYAPKGAKNLPVMIYIHGGGWRTGDKRSISATPAYFTRRGFVFVSLNYRLVPAVDILTQLQDS